MRDLLKDYERRERPVANESDPVNVNHGLSLQQIVELDLKKQILTSNIWQNFEWTDVNLKWNPSEYGNIQDIRLPPQDIWIPDIMLFNTASFSTSDPNHLPTRVVVRHDGGCTWIPPMIARSTCKIFEKGTDQKCTIKFGSWTYNGFKLNLETSNIDTSTYVLNEEWGLVNATAKRNEVYYECCPEPYLDITYTINLRKKQKTWLEKGSGLLGLN